jgi:transcriptional antiterminator RfaH
VNQDSASEKEALRWYCVRSQPKHEKIAADHLRMLEVEVFSPRIRYKRSTKRGPAWVTESLFPNYLFARFDLKSSLSKVTYATGVSGVVHFGHVWPAIDDDTIADLQRTFANDSIHHVPDEFEPGEEVGISGGAFHGLKAVIARPLSGKDRVCVLLDFLGRQTEVEVDRQVLVKTEVHPLKH